MSTPPARRQIDDPDVLKAMTHPLRQRLFRLLAQLGPATVGNLADKVGSEPGRVSYHLRELGRRGFIEEAPDLARDRRETWWRIVPGSWSWDREDFTTPEGRAVYSTLYAQTVADELARLRAWEEASESWPDDWRRSSISNQSYLFLTPEELRRLNEDLRTVFERWAEVGRAAREAGETHGRAPVFAFLHAFPEDPDNPGNPDTPEGRSAPDDADDRRQARNDDDS